MGQIAIWPTGWGIVEGRWDMKWGRSKRERKAEAAVVTGKRAKVTWSMWREIMSCASIWWGMKEAEKEGGWEGVLIYILGRSHILAWMKSWIFLVVNSWISDGLGGMNAVDSAVTGFPTSSEPWNGVLVDERRWVRDRFYWNHPVISRAATDAQDSYKDMVVSIYQL